MTWTADFETTRDPPVRVWLWASCNINDESQVDIGYNINSFFEWMKGKDSIYIHNLKFDGHFLIYHLYKNMCWKYSQNSEPCTFCTVIGNMGQWYKISITYGDGETVHIFDSLKKLPMSIERMAKAFKLDIAKGSIDHTKIRDENYKPDENEEDYVKTDVKIPAQALALQFAKGLTKMTAGADALNKFKETIKDFREYFPVLNDAVDSDLRKSYKGGYVYVAEKYQGKTLGKGQVYDVNSMYPWAMRYKMLPYGKPIYFSGEYNQDDEYPLYIIKFIADFSLKKGYIPTVQIKNSPRFLGTEYIKNSDGLQELTMTNIDFEIFKRHYEINGIEFEYGYKFKGKTGIFNKYIDYWMEVKQNSEGGMRELAKLMLNSLYGKFAKNADVTGKIPIYDSEKDLIRLIKGKEERSETNYLPIGAYITAYSRENIINAAISCGNTFVYCDTDSLHLVGDDIPDIDIHPSRIGAWKLENTFNRARFLHAKCYIEEMDTGKCKVTCAGLPESCKGQVNFSNFKIGAEYTGKLQQRSVAGGCYLEETTFKIGDK